MWKTTWRRGFLLRRFTTPIPGDVHRTEKKLRLIANRRLQRREEQHALPVPDVSHATNLKQGTTHRKAGGYSEHAGYSVPQLQEC